MKIEIKGHAWITDGAERKRIEVIVDDERLKQMIAKELRLSFPKEERGFEVEIDSTKAT